MQHEPEDKTNKPTPAISTNSDITTDLEYPPYIFLRLGFQEEAEAAMKAIAEERERPGSFDSAQPLLRAKKVAFDAAESLALAQKPWTLSRNELEEASFASSHGDSTPDMNDFEGDDDATSENYSALSLACGTETIGLQSQLGATCPYTKTCTANIGFSFGIPRPEKWKGVREERLGDNEGCRKGRKTCCAGAGCDDQGCDGGEWEATGG